MDFQLTGTIHEIYPSQQKTEKFKSREFVLKVSKEIGEREITDYVKISNQHKISARYWINTK